MAGKHSLEEEEPPVKRPRLDAGNKSSSIGPTSDELAVGITQYVSPETAGFSCVVKQRYTDFLVNEILPDGRVLHLDQVPRTGHHAQKNGEHPAVNGDNVQETSEAAGETLPEVPAEPAEFDNDAGNNAEEVPEMTSEEQATLRRIFGEETTSKILHLTASMSKYPHSRPRDHPTVKSKVIAEKSKRTEAHVAIRRIFNSRLMTETLQDEQGVISIKAAAVRIVQAPHGKLATNQDGSYQKGRVRWEELGGEWLHFTLYKENKDTMEVLQFLAGALKVPVKNIEFAGTKDRRGVTTQRMAVYRITADRLEQAQKLAKGWVVGGFEYKKQGLDLGQSDGNEFVMTLRDVAVAGGSYENLAEILAHAREKIAKAAEAFKEKGFINYYGLQRFGTFSIGTHAIGLKMLQGDLEGAVNSILAYSKDLLEEQPPTSKVPHDDINRARAIHIWRETGRSHEALKRMPKRFQAEISIIQFLGHGDKENGQRARDWQGALMMIQRKLRLMYVHAYQSLVWNMAAGKRWDLFGDTVVAGDLVVVGEHDGDAGSSKKDEVDEDGEPVFHPAEHDQSASAADAFTRARPVLQAEVDSGKFSIFDIVLPQPGFDVVYPSNAIGNFYEGFMGSEEGGKLDPHKMRRSWKDISLSGGYRKMMAKPGKDLKTEVRGYDDDDEQLVETDLERLKREAANSGSSANGTSAHCSDGGGKDLEGPKKSDEATLRKLAVVMRLQLRSSQYATMALRELTKGGAVNFKPEFSMNR